MPKTKRVTGVDDEPAPKKARVSHSKVCEICPKKPYYGFEGVGARMCREHRLEGMLHLKCNACSCGKKACFGIAGEKAVCCKQCKTVEMIDVTNRKCAEKGCNTQPKYGVIDRKPTHCYTHGTALGMIDVMHERCIDEGCNIRANYGSTKNKPTHCAKHGTLLGLTNVVDVRCAEVGCETHRSYGLIDNRPTHCAQHGTVLNMRDVTHQKCSKTGCILRASYGVVENKPTHCATHGKALNMIDVTHMICTEDGCQIQCNYGFEAGKPTHCAQHGIALGMRDVSNKKCVVGDCIIQPTYGVLGEQATHCVGHGAPLGLVDVNHKRCEHGSRNCSGYAETCGKTLYGRSKEEVRTAAFVYMCYKATADLSHFLSTLKMKYAPEADSKWTNEFEDRVLTVINVDMVLDISAKHKLFFEYDGKLWHQDKIDLDTAKTVEILSSGASVLRVRDRLPSLNILNPNYHCVDVSAQWSTMIVTKKVHASLGITKDWNSVWQASHSLGERAIAHFIDPSQPAITQFFAHA